MGRAVRNTLGVGILGKSGCGRRTSNNYENFAYGILVRESGLAGSPRPAQLYHISARLSIGKMHKKNLHFLCRLYRVALVRSHFKPSCVLRTIYIADGRSLCGGSVPHFQFTVLLRQLVPSHHRPFPLEVALDRLHSYSAKVRLLHPRCSLCLYYNRG